MNFPFIDDAIVGSDSKKIFRSCFGLFLSWIKPRLI